MTALRDDAGVIDSDRAIKQRVRAFYDSVGWSQIGEGLYQNARYEDLRAVSREYIHRCHLRVARHLPSRGRFMLDAGSGPIQYPEYLEYSKGYESRLCLDISMRALTEARRRIGDRGLFVVGDIAHLPFVSDAMDGLVSLHAVHHLPAEDHERAFREFYRVLRPEGRAVVVTSWGDRCWFVRLTQGPIRLSFRLISHFRRRRHGADPWNDPSSGTTEASEREASATGTFTYKHDYTWTKATLGNLPGFEIRVWRTASTQFLRAFIHRRLLGQCWLRVVYLKEELMPHFFGWFGQYPMILFRKPGADGVSEARSAA